MTESILKSETLKAIDCFEKKCTACNQCTSFCSFHMPVRISPKAFASQLRENPEDILSLIRSYDCSNCGYCQVNCPENIDFQALHEQIKIDLGRHRLIDKSAKRVVDTHQKMVFHKLLNHATTGFTAPEKRKVFFPGCALIAFQPELALATFEYLEEQNDNIGLMSLCCGKPTKTIGDEDAFSNRFQQVTKEIQNQSIQEIITACPNCHQTLKEHLPHVEVTHISQSILKYGLLDSGPLQDTGQQVVTVHDPCPLRQETEIHTSVRTLLEHMGYQVRQRRQSEEQTICCGSGGMIKVLSPKAAETYGNVMASVFQENEPIITYCQECVQTLSDKKLNAHHLLNLIFSEHHHSNDCQESVSFLKKWTNRIRYNMKIKLKKGP